MKKEIPSDVLQEARKLCALSDDPTATTYEIEQALKLAHRILLPYGLTVDDIRGLRQKDLIQEEYTVPGRQRRSYWLHDLMTNIAGFTDTDYMWNSGWRVRYIFVGLLSEVQRAIFHAETLYEQIEYYTQCRAPLHMRDVRVYKQGIVDRLHQTMRSLKHPPPQSVSVSPIVERILTKPEGTRFLVLAPVKEDLADLDRRGFTRVRLDGQTREIKDLLESPPQQITKIEAIVDRIIVRDGQDARLADSLQAAFNLSPRVVYLENTETSQRMAFRAKAAQSAATPEVPVEVRRHKRLVIRSYIDERARGRGADLQRTAFAYEYNPDYQVGFQHGAEIQIRDGIGRRWQNR